MKNERDEIPKPDSESMDIVQLAMIGDNSMFIFSKLQIQFNCDLRIRNSLVCLN